MLTRDKKKLVKKLAKLFKWLFLPRPVCDHHLLFRELQHSVLDHAFGKHTYKVLVIYLRNPKTVVNEF